MRGDTKLCFSVLGVAYALSSSTLPVNLCPIAISCPQYQRTANYRFRPGTTGNENTGHRLRLSTNTCACSRIATVRNPASFLKGRGGGPNVFSFLCFGIKKHLLLKVFTRYRASICESFSMQKVRTRGRLTFIYTMTRGFFRRQRRTCSLLKTIHSLFLRWNRPSSYCCAEKLVCASMVKV